MFVNFTYKKDRDIWCLLTKGKSSNNSPNPTQQYEQLIEKYGENPSTATVSHFIDDYIAKNHISIAKCITNYQNDWETVSADFQKKAEDIFNISLPYDITAYLTINSRCPYSIQDNVFYVSLQSRQPRRTIMHELWHFYTWYGLGTHQEETLGKHKYNDLKEALTVLLNVECGDLLPPGAIDAGYPQHQQIRGKILEYWKTDKHIINLWQHLIEIT